MEAVTLIAHLLGGRTVLGRRVRTWADLERVVREGLPKRSLQLVARHVVEPGTAPNELVYRVVPQATFKRRDRLSAEESERTERLARVAALADVMWEDEAESRAFLNRSHPLLGGETPLNVARTELGARRVERLLHDAEHGLAI